MIQSARTSFILWCAVTISASRQACAQPLADYHQHFFSPAIVKRATGLEPISANDLIALLDAAGIRRALVLSIAYQFSNPNRPPVADEYTQVKAENDWTSQQVSRFPHRLRGFCSLNPLKDYALAELERCVKDRYLRYGLKLHFGNSDVQLENPEHLTRVQRVFRACNRRRVAIIVHMRSSVTMKRPFGAEQAGIFLNNLLKETPNIPVQIAHLAGAGSYDETAVDQALQVFVDAIARRDPRMRRVYFDVSGVAGLGNWLQKVDLIAARIRQLGVNRILYGSDGAGGGNPTPAQAWAAFRKLPLTDAEFRVIEQNTTSYMPK